jgi:hypothetical protein
MTGPGPSARAQPLQPISHAACLLALAAMLAPSGAPAQRAAERRFDIPAQPLATAIAAYARTAEVGVAFDANDMADRRSSAVTGRATPQAAIGRMLEGTGLTARFTARDSVIIVASRAPGVVARSDGHMASDGRMTIDLDAAVVTARRTIGRPDPGPLFAYARRAQVQLQDIFTRDPAFRDADFRFRVAVALDDGGRVSAATLLGSSGAPERDRLVVPRILGHNMGTPPAGLLQPLTFEIIGTLPARTMRTSP